MGKQIRCLDMGFIRVTYLPVSPLPNLSVYTTKPSASFVEADIYASGRRVHQLGLKSIILNHVVLGRTTLIQKADHSLQHAPEIYNSVSIILDLDVI